MREGLRLRYMEWFATVLDEVEEKGESLVVLSDNLVGKFYFGEDEFLHWKLELPDGLIEKLASLEHEQWAHWTQYFLSNLSPENIERWKRQCETPYEELTEEERESDRAWAKKVLKLFQEAE